MCCPLDSMSSGRFIPVGWEAGRASRWLRDRLGGETSSGKDARDIIHMGGREPGASELKAIVMLCCYL
jgi:hypothetical protein